MKYLLAIGLLLCGACTSSTTSSTTSSEGAVPTVTQSTVTQSAPAANEGQVLTMTVVDPATGMPQVKMYMVTGGILLPLN